MAIGRTSYIDGRDSGRAGLVDLIGHAADGFSEIVLPFSSAAVSFVEVLAKVFQVIAGVGEQLL